MKIINRFLLYILGMAILALGLSLSTKLSLGVSALTAFPFMISEIYNLNFGNVTLVYYIVIIIIQILIHIKMHKYKLITNDLLQVFKDLKIKVPQVAGDFGGSRNLIVLTEYSPAPHYSLNSTFLGFSYVTVLSSAYVTRTDGTLFSLTNSTFFRP